MSLRSRCAPGAVAWAIAIAALGGCGGAPASPSGPAPAGLAPAPLGTDGKTGGAAPSAPSGSRRGEAAIDETAATASLRRWLPAAPPFVPYSPKAPSAAVAACAAEPTPRGAASCLLRTRDRAAFAELLKLGQKTRKRGDDRPMEGAAWVDEAGAVEAAGAIAAMTSTDELVAMASDPAPKTRAFALAGLNELLRTMDTHDHVKTTQAQRDAADLAIGRVCAAHLAEDDVEILHQVLNCLWKSGYRPAGPAVAALAAYHRVDAVRASAAVAYTQLVDRESLDPRVAMAMMARLRAPMSSPRSIDDENAREWICHDLERGRPKGTPGMGEAALEAVRLMSAAGTPTPTRGCSELAERELTPPPAPKRPHRGVDGDDAYCEIAQSESLPKLELCLDGAAMGSADARLSVTIRDRGGRDPSGERNQLVASFPIRVEPGQRSAVREARWTQLSDTVRVGLIPIVQRGATPADDARSLTVVVIDLARRTFQDVARTPWCRGCDGVGTRSGRGELDVTEHRNHVKAQMTSFVWDGTRLRLK